jgi:hypothetical protein
MLNNLEHLILILGKGLKAHSKEKDIGLESALSERRGLESTLKEKRRYGLSRKR